MASLIFTCNGYSPHFHHQFPTSILSGLYKGTQRIFSGYINMVVKATDIEDKQGINLVNSFSHRLSYFKLAQSN